MADFFGPEYWDKDYFPGSYWPAGADGDAQGGPLTVSGSATITIAGSYVERTSVPSGGGFPRVKPRRELPKTVQGGPILVMGNALILVADSGVNNDSEILMVVS